MSKVHLIEAFFSTKEMLFAFEEEKMMLKIYVRYATQRNAQARCEQCNSFTSETKVSQVLLMFETTGNEISSESDVKYTQEKTFCDILQRNAQINLG